MQVRCFASSSSRRVGPESPNFIDIPQPIQPELPQKPRVKGTLPVPRELFPARRADKPSKEYLDAATTRPTKQREIDPNDPHAGHIEEKRKMADMRRRNLREGLTELYTRKTTTDHIMAVRSQAKQERRTAILKQRERDDERLTRPSVHKSMMAPKVTTSFLPDPNRKQRLARSRQRLKRVEEKKAEHKKLSLQALFMNARTFIVSEAQLAEEIDRVFPEGDNPAWRSDQQQGENIWNLGPPPALQSLVNDPKRNEAARFDLIQGRVKKLGEHITGGKM